MVFSGSSTISPCIQLIKDSLVPVPDRNETRKRRADSANGTASADGKVSFLSGIGITSKPSWAALVVAMLLPCLACGASLDIVKPVEAFLKESGAPGVSVSVLEKGQTQPQTVARGFACLDNEVPMQGGTVMKIGSVSKVFTGLRIKMLIEEGALSEITPLSQFFPVVPRGDEITIQHLLTHTSGLTEMLRLEPFTSNMARPWSPQEIVEIVAKQPLDFAPGTAQKYSNSNYLMLGRIIEIITGEPYAKQIRNKIAVPLGMKQLQSGDDVSIIRHESCGHAGGKPDALRKPMMASMIPPMATGNLIGTSEDIVRLVNLGRLQRHNLIDTPPTAPWVLADGRVAQTTNKFLDLEFNQSLLDGMAYFSFSDRKMNLVGKDGMFPGFASWFLYDPQTRTAVAVVTNLETKSIEAMQLAVRVLEAQRKVKKGVVQKK